jgi:cytochrome P450
MTFREKSIWGEDAEEFRPLRWIEDNMKKSAIGPYANLLTFWGGARTCVGWRFA